MNYKGYTIEQDITGYAPKEMKYAIFFDEEYICSGRSIDKCRKIIDEIIAENETNDNQTL